LTRETAKLSSSSVKQWLKTVKTKRGADLTFLDTARDPETYNE
jgi:hypothetical protein